MQEVLNTIDGRQASAAGGEWLDDVDPATGETYARVASSDGRDVEKAVAAAVRAFAGWSRTPAAERSKALRRLARLIERDLEQLARAESIDSGKPLWLARSVDIPRAVQNFDFFADAATQFASEAHPTDEVALNYTLRQPLGVGGVHLAVEPAALSVDLEDRASARRRKLRGGQALRADADDGVDLLGELSSEAGLPPGVLNIVHGLRRRAPARRSVAHRDVRAISFTGVAPGSAARSRARRRRRVQEDLAGDGRQEPDADLRRRGSRDRAPRGGPRRLLEHQGQICLCGSRIFDREERLRPRPRRAGRAGAERCASAIRSRPAPSRARSSRGSTSTR